jgi:molybdenum transport protein
MIGSDMIAHLLDEDVAGGDVTTDALGFGHRAGEMLFKARGPMVVAGIGVSRKMMAGLDVALYAADGDRVEAGTLLLRAHGPAAELHLVWKASQTLMEVLGGIATATADVVAAARAANPAIRVATTRKTVPGARRLSQLAVRAGGGIIHRAGLGETVLVFAEHRAFLPDWSLARLAEHLRLAQPEKAIGIEVDTLDEGKAAADAGFDVIQLERFSPDDVARLAAYVAGRTPRPRLGAAGGVHPDNAGAYARAGADLIVTSWPYTAKPRDVSVTLRPLG